jgi:hypothetical protein
LRLRRLDWDGGLGDEDRHESGIRRLGQDRHHAAEDDRVE